MRSHIIEFIHQTGFALKVPFAPKVLDLYLKSGKNGTLGAKLINRVSFAFLILYFFLLVLFLLFGNTIVLFIFARLIEAEEFDFCLLFLIK